MPYLPARSSRRYYGELTMEPIEIPHITCPCCGGWRLSRVYLEVTGNLSPGAHPVLNDIKLLEVFADCLDCGAVSSLLTTSEKK